MSDHPPRRSPILWPLLILLLFLSLTVYFAIRDAHSNAYPKRSELYCTEHGEGGEICTQARPGAASPKPAN